MLVMDVKGFKLDVIRTARLYCTLYMNTMEWKDTAVGVWKSQILKSRHTFFFKGHTKNPLAISISNNLL